MVTFNRKIIPTQESPIVGFPANVIYQTTKKGVKFSKCWGAPLNNDEFFTVGLSQTSGKENVVMLNEIHHKTKRCGGPEQ